MQWLSSDENVKIECIYVYLVGNVLYLREQNKKMTKTADPKKTT